MMWASPIYRDRQQDPVFCRCSNPYFRAELYGEDEIMPGGLCPECWEDMVRNV